MWSVAIAIGIGSVFAIGTEPEPVVPPGARTAAEHARVVPIDSTPKPSVQADGPEGPELLADGPPTSASTYHYLLDGYSTNSTHYLPAFRWRSGMVLYSNYGTAESVPKGAISSFASLFFIAAGWCWGALAAILQFALNLRLTEDVLDSINQGFVRLLDAFDATGLTFLVIAVALFAIAKAVLRGRATQVVSIILALCVCIGFAYALRDMSSNGQTVRGKKGTTVAGLTAPVGSPAWIAVQGLSLVDTVGNQVTSGFELVGGGGTKYEAPQAMRYWTPNCADYIQTLNNASVAFGKNEPNLNQLQAINQLWLDSYLPNYTRAQYGNVNEGYRAVCHYLEAGSNAHTTELKAMLTLAAKEGTGTATGYGTAANEYNLLPEGNFGAPKDFEASQFGWIACYRTDGPTSGKGAPNPREPGRDADIKNLDDGRTGDDVVGENLKPTSGSVEMGGRKIDGWAVRWGWGVVGSASGDDCARWWVFGPGKTSLNPYGGTEEVKGLDRWKWGSGAKFSNRVTDARNESDGGNARNANAIRSVQSTVTGFWGHNVGARFLGGLIAFITSIVFLWAIGGLAVGCVVALIGLILMLVLLPASLLLAALPGARDRANPLGVRMLKMTAGFFAARLLLLVCLIILVQTIALMNQLISANNLGDSGSYITMLTPLAALYLLRKLLSQIGLGNVTSLAGAVGAATAGAVALGGTQGNNLWDGNRAGRMQDKNAGAMRKLQDKRRALTGVGRRGGQLGYAKGRSALARAGAKPTWGNPEGGPYRQWQVRALRGDPSALSAARWVLGTSRKGTYAVSDHDSTRAVSGAKRPPALSAGPSEGTGGTTGSPTIIPGPVIGPSGELVRTGDLREWTSDFKGAVRDFSDTVGDLRVTVDAQATVSHTDLVSARREDRRSLNFDGDTAAREMAFNVQFAERAAALAAAFQAVRDSQGNIVVDEDGRPVMGFVDNDGEAVETTASGEPADRLRGVHVVVDPVANLNDTQIEAIRNQYASYWHLAPEEVLVSRYGTGAIVRPPESDVNGRRRTLTVGDPARDRALAELGVFFLSDAIKHRANGLSESGAALYFHQALIETGLLDPYTGQPSDFFQAAGLNDADVDAGLAADRAGQASPLDDIVFDLPGERIAALRAYAADLDSADMSWALAAQARETRERAVSAPIESVRDAGDRVEESAQVCRGLLEVIEGQIEKLRAARTYQARLGVSQPAGGDTARHAERVERAGKAVREAERALSELYSPLVGEMTMVFNRVLVAEDQCRWLEWAADIAANQGDPAFDAEIDRRIDRYEQQWAQRTDEELSEACAHWEREILTGQATLKQAIDSKDPDAVKAAIDRVDAVLDTIEINTRERGARATARMAEVQSRWDRDEARDDEQRARHSTVTVGRPQRDERIGAWR